MLIAQLSRFKIWYQQRLLREQILVFFLMCAAVYATFSLILLDPLDRQREQYQKALSKAAQDQKSWDLQLSAIRKISQTPLYQQWQQQNGKLSSLKEEYRSLIKKPLDKKWEEVITAILQSQSNIVMENISSLPEKQFNQGDLVLSNSGLFEQEITVTILSNYFDTLSYLKHLEATLPNLHWKKLVYHVQDYPVARVQMEFSIIYEKSSS